MYVRSKCSCDFTTDVLWSHMYIASQNAQKSTGGDIMVSRPNIGPIYFYAVEYGNSTTFTNFNKTLNCHRLVSVETLSTTAYVYRKLRKLNEKLHLNLFHFSVICCLQMSTVMCQCYKYRNLTDRVYFELNLRICIIVIGGDYREPTSCLAR